MSEINLQEERILVKKASGDDEYFDIKKLERSLHNAGAEELTIE